MERGGSGGEDEEDPPQAADLGASADAVPPPAAPGESDRTENSASGSANATPSTTRSSEHHIEVELGGEGEGGVRQKCTSRTLPSPNGSLPRKNLNGKSRFFKQTTSSERNVRVIEIAQKTMCAFLVAKDPKGINVWFKYFDKNKNGRVSIHEFKSAMSALRFPGNAEALFEDLDAEALGEVSYDQIHEDKARAWNEFRRWCGVVFQGPRDMIRQIKRGFMQLSQQQQQDSRSLQALEEVLNPEEFTIGLRFLGYTGGSEEFLFWAIANEEENSMSARDLKWLEVNVERFRRKEEAKKKAIRVAEQRARSKQAGYIALRDFKAFLKNRFGHLFHAWRAALDLDGTMSVGRAELFKACRSLNWRGDVRALWKALDHDGSGTSTLEELDPHCAQLLAQFKGWAVSVFGHKPSASLWHAFDRQRRRKLSYAQFAQECERLGFAQRGKIMAKLLDWEDKRFVVEEDLSVLDAWRAPEYLVATANKQAAEDFKNHLLHRYGHLLKAWRSTLDKDNSNCCNWHEFQDAAKHARHTGDIAGAWLALDEDLSGYISLKELDPNTHKILMDFKQWADDEFGGVRSAFRVMDTDNSSELTYAEFRRACTNYGYSGDVLLLFSCLDQHGEMKLQYKEVCFLDEWQDGETDSFAEDGIAEQIANRDSEALESLPSRMLDYRTPVPGPGAYDVRAGFGAMPSAPTVKHSGAFSFTRRSAKRPWLLIGKTVGPAKYDPKFEPIALKKPSWSFGSSSTAKGSFMENPRGALSPGPGAYEMKSSLTGPQFSMRPRRGMVLHPKAAPQLDSVYSRPASVISYARSPTPAPMAPLVPVLPRRG